MACILKPAKSLLPPLTHVFALRCNLPDVKIGIQLSIRNNYQVFHIGCVCMCDCCTILILIVGIAQGAAEHRVELAQGR